MSIILNDLTKIFNNDIAYLNTYSPDGSLNLDNKNLITLEGIISDTIYGDLYCRHNKLITLKGCPKEIDGVFDCRYNDDLKNPIKEIIENQIVALMYNTDDGQFLFKDIKEEFLKFKIEKENNKKIIINTILKDYGLSLN